MSSGPLPPVFTVGHSTRSIEAFVDLLRVGRVEMVVDIRSIPRSRTNPDYNLDRLPFTIAERQIGHVQIPELGGLRKASQGVPDQVNAFWSNRSFHHYADYALSDEFGRGFDRLIELSRSRRCAIMCSEAVWWRCHRRMVADYLLAAGREVFHLMGEKKVDPARMTNAARTLGDKLVYPAETESEEHDDGRQASFPL